MWISWNGLTGRNPSAIPDPPEPPSDRWLDDHCPRCKYNHEWEENGVWYGECTAPYGCDFEEREDDED